MSRDEDRVARDGDRGQGEAEAETEREGEVARLLDTIIVGYDERKPEHRDGNGDEDGEGLVKELQRFSQTVRSTLGSSEGDESITQAEVSLRFHLLNS